MTQGSWLRIFNLADYRGRLTMTAATINSLGRLKSNDACTNALEVLEAGWAVYRVPASEMAFFELGDFESCDTAAI